MVEDLEKECFQVEEKVPAGGKWPHIQERVKRTGQSGGRGAARTCREVRSGPGAALRGLISMKKGRAGEM